MEADLDPNEVAAYVAGRLTPRERASFEARAAADPEAQLLLRALREDAAPRRARLWSLAAAVVLVAVGGSLWLARERRGEESVHDRLVAAAADLARAEPVSFASFEPFRAEELAATESAMRGGARWVAPRGTVLTPPTELRWRNAPGSEEVAVSIEGPDVAWKQALRGERAPAPALVPGRYVVTLRPVGSLAAQESRAAFVVADGALRTEHERGVTAIRSRAPADLADLLIAHWALRRGLREEAREAATRARERSAPVREAADALLRHLADAPARG
jgi:hypothetical protein